MCILFYECKWFVKFLYFEKTSYKNKKDHLETCFCFMNLTKNSTIILKKIKLE